MLRLTSLPIVLFNVFYGLLLVKKIIWGMYIPPGKSLYYSYIDMFTDIENTIVNAFPQVCLLGDFNANTNIAKDYIDIDDYVLNNCII